MFRFLSAGVAFLAMAPGTAAAYDWAVTANVGTIEVSYVPSNIPFTINTAAGSCPAGSFLVWNPHGSNADEKAQNVQAVLAGLLTARSANRTIVIFGNNAGCTVDYIHLN